MGRLISIYLDFDGISLFPSSVAFELLLDFGANEAFMTSKIGAVEIGVMSEVFSSLWRASEEVGVASLAGV